MKKKKPPPSKKKTAQKQVGEFEGFTVVHLPEEKQFKGIKKIIHNFPPGGGVNCAKELFWFFQEDLKKYYLNRTNEPVKTKRKKTSTIDVDNSAKNANTTINEKSGKDKAAQTLGRKGGKARAAALTKERRTEIAKAAAKVRWPNSEK